MPSPYFNRHAMIMPVKPPYRGPPIREDYMHESHLPLRSKKPSEEPILSDLGLFLWRLLNIRLPKPRKQ